MLLIVLNSITGLVYLLAGNFLAKNMPVEIPKSIMLLLSILGIVNVVCAAMLLKWKRWGFWGFVTTSVVALIINISIGMGVGKSILGLAGLGILYAILQIKENNVSAWKNLE